MELKTEIICENFEQKKIHDNKIYVDEASEEYYIIPLNHSFSIEYDDEVYKLTFTNQQLWLKYSNHFKEIKIYEYEYDECVLIKSADILDIYSIILCDDYIRKNTWQSLNVNIKRKDIGKYYLVIPIIEEMVNVKKFGVNDYFYQIEVITNEIRMKKVMKRSDNAGNITITNNINLCGEALFIRLSDDDVRKVSHIE